MPYVCRVTITGPEPDAEGVTQMMDAVASAIEAGWEAPRVVTDDDIDREPLSETADDDGPDGNVLDYRVLGYPGGAIILVVLDGDDLMQTSVAITGLAQHLTTWSPGLLEYTPEEVSISRASEPDDGESWLPHFGEDDSDADGDSERPRWPVAELLDDDLQGLAAQYLLVQAVRSLWHPADPVEGNQARDMILGAVEDPWGRELTRALGGLLIRAARFERGTGTFADLVVQGSGEPALAADLLRRARETATQTETDGWDDDETRGHLLVETFAEEQQLRWNRAVGDESPHEYTVRRNRQLKALLWAGLRALATMARPLASLSGPWQLLDELGGDAVVSLLAEGEEAQHEEDAEEDWADVESAAAAAVLTWLAIRHPELLDGPAVGRLLDQVADDTSALHQVAAEALLMAGAGRVRQALATVPPPPGLEAAVTQFVAALERTESADDEAGEPYDDLHAALDAVLAEGPGLRFRIRWLLSVTGLSAWLTAGDGSQRRPGDDQVTSPLALSRYLVATPAMHAAVVLHRHDEDDAVRTRMLSLAATVAPVATADLAAELPDLAGLDPLLEPAARTRAASWVDRALRVARERGRPVTVGPNFADSADARLVAEAVTQGLDLPAVWPAARFTAACAEAAAAILHMARVTEFADQVFGDSE